MELSEKRIEEMKSLLEKKSGKEVAWAEAEESLRSLIGLVELMWDIWRRDEQRKKRLEVEPDGFPLEGGYSCFICGQSGDIWYDKYGYSCPLCLAARKKRIIPVEAYRKKESWYAMWELDHYFGAKSATIRKFIRNGKLKVRIVPDDSGRAHYYLFMIKDNVGFLPPKPKSYAVQDGKWISMKYEKVASLFVD
jgi:hypothetical protein